MARGRGALTGLSPATSRFAATCPWFKASSASAAALSVLLPIGSAATAQTAIAPPPANQHTGFDASATVRVRYEGLDGQVRANLPDEEQRLAVRTTAAAEYRWPQFRIAAEIYDSRAYLDGSSSALGTGEVNALELVQAYAAADLGAALGARTSLQVRAGRMMLNLGSRRLIAADDYRNTTNGYTGVVADVRVADHLNATLFYTLPQIRLPDDPGGIDRAAVRWDRESFDLRLWGGLVAWPGAISGATAELGYVRLQEQDGPRRPTRNRNLHNLSARVIREPEPGQWDFEAEGIIQLGSIRSNSAPTAARLPVTAWFVHLDLGYTLPGPARLRVSAEYDHASGDGPGRSFGRFDTVFGMRRADLSPAGILSAIGRTNISTGGVRAEIAPSRRCDAFAAYRAMWLAERTDSFATTGVRDATGESGRFAGHQIEARVRYWLIPQRLRAEWKGVWIAKGRFLDDAPNAPATGDTLYMSTALTVSF